MSSPCGERTMSLVRHRHIRSLVSAMLLASLAGLCPLVTDAIEHDAMNCVHARADQTAPATVFACCRNEHQLRGLVPVATQQSSPTLVPLPGWTTADAPVAGRFNHVGTETRATASTPPAFS